MIFAPLEGRRESLVTERHMAVDCPRRSACRRRVQGNLNTDKPASLRQALAARVADSNKKSSQGRGRQGQTQGAIPSSLLEMIGSGR
jgi:hypothetical protein